MQYKERRIFVTYLRSEFRRLNRDKAEERSSAPVVYLPKNMVVCPKRPVDTPMSLPACLLTPDTQAGRERFRAHILSGGSPLPIVARGAHMRKVGE